MNPIQSNRSGLPARILAALAASPDIPHAMRPRSPFRRTLTSAALLLAVLGFLRPAALHAAPWTPAELGSSSLALWLDASDAGTITLSGSTVSQWNDKSGNNRHVAQATATKKPSYANNILNGLSAVSFDGSDDSLFASAATITLSQPVHRFIACKFLTKTSKSVVFVSYTSAPSFFFYNGENAGQWVFDAGSSISYGTADTSNNHIHYNHVNGASSYVSVDGTTTLTGPGNPGANTLQGVRIGHQRGEYPGYAFQGYVYEVVLVQGTLTADNRQKVEGYLASKWGLQANLPADHPYKSAAPESVDTNLLSFIWGSHTGVIDQNAKTVSLTVPYGTDVTTINPTCTVSSGATVSPASEANAGFIPSNLTVTYTVTSGASHTDYAATVTVEAVSSACDMLTFAAAGRSGVISGTNVTLLVPYDADVTTLAPTYTVSQYATGSPASDIARNFTASQDYIVTAQDGSTSKTYTVTVYKLAQPGTIATVPPGLQPGDQYRLVFVTSTTRDAASANIADYNTFVSGRAAAVSQLNALGTTWKAIAATLAVDVRTNTLTGATDTSVPIYRLDGAQVATGNTDLWDASIAYPISINESGTSVTARVWTGVGETFGNEYRLGTGGWNYYGWSTGAVKTPYANRVGGTGWTANLDQGSTASFPLYAISGILMVPLPGTDLLSFIWGSHIGVIDQEAKTVSLTVPYGTDLTTINPTCTVSSGATVSPASGANAGFTESNKTVTYTVTSGASHTDYAATVTVEPASSACDMLTFKSGNYSAALVGTNVSLMVPYGTDVTTLSPTYTMSPGATEDVSYPSGSARDFTNPQTYTITAQNGTDAKIYTVSVLTVPVTVPRGLNPGDSYRLVFVTNGTRDAVSTDIADRGFGTAGVDFLTCRKVPMGCRSIVTNPPYGDTGSHAAQSRSSKAMLEFLRHALGLTASVQGQLALLVRLQWIAGQRAAEVMSAAPFAAVVVLRQRIRWFDMGERTNTAQHHHAWVVFDHAHPPGCPPALLYA